MKRIGKPLLTLGAVAAAALAYIRKQLMIVVSLVAVAGLIAAPAVAQDIKSVVVVNDSGQPVPTAAQGTTTVAGTVNIGNTPGVTVTNPLDGQGKPTPLTVLDATQPYEDFCIAGFAGTNGALCKFSTIPAGKRLVIQAFDAAGFLETGLKPVKIAFQPGTIQHFFPATFMGTSPGSPALDNFATHQETRLYAPPGSTPNVQVLLTGSSSHEYFCVLSGFLVDLP